MAFLAALGESYDCRQGYSFSPNPTANSVSVIREEFELVRMISSPLGYFPMPKWACLWSFHQISDDWK